MTMMITSFLGQEWEFVSGITSSVYQFWDIKNKFDDAKDLCTGQQGHLLRLETETEYQNIKKKIISIGKKLFMSQLLTLSSLLYCMLHNTKMVSKRVLVLLRAVVYLGL